MKYLLALFFIIVLNNCGGGSSKKNHNFKATVIDGYLVESNISIYDTTNKLLENIKTNDDASFSYKNLKHDFLYIKATSGIDTMTNEVFNSSLYGIAIKGHSVVVSPLSSVVQSYYSHNQDNSYKELARNIEKNLNLTKNILTFDPIVNISNEESSKIIQTNITLEFVARLFNTVLGGNFEHITYAYSYKYINKYKDMSFLYSDAFIDDMSDELHKKFNYLNEYIVNLKLSSLKSSIAYIVDELSYLKADNKELLKKNYKASYILTWPIIKEASLMHNLKIKDTNYASEYFNSINSEIKSLDLDEILNGLKIMGGLRGILYRINDINREAKTIKSSYYSNFFLNKELLLKSSVTYNHLSRAIVSGAPSQDAPKDNMIRNTIFSNMENQDIFDSKILKKIQDQVSLLVVFSKENAINTNAELLLKEEIIKESKKDFTNYIKPLVSDIATNHNNAIVASKIDAESINKNNKESLTFYQDDIYIKNELQLISIKKQNQISDLVGSNSGKSIIERSSDLELIKIEEDLLKEKINKNELSKEVVNYKTKLSVIDNDNVELKTKAEEVLKKYESFTKSSENKITDIKNAEAREKIRKQSIYKILEDKTSKKYLKLLKVHTENKTKETKEQNIISLMKKAKKVYDRKINKAKKDKAREENIYETNLNILSNSLSNGEDTNLSLINLLNKELRIIAALERTIANVKVFKRDLEGPIDFTVNLLKQCFDQDDNDLFSITINQDNSFVKVEVINLPKNTIFSNNALKRKKEDGINLFYMPLGIYDANITVSNTDIKISKTKLVHFEVKEDCVNDISPAFNAPLQIPNIPNLAAPELNVSSDLPNPNSGQNPPKLNDNNKPPKDN